MSGPIWVPFPWAEVTMPQVPKRETLEHTGQLEPYQSAGRPRQLDGV